ncbi:MAG: ankyrin repeat domain-containing protein [Flavobacterium sp.]|nr:ankyrin repeat domain-containing protein [Flavobacterium sp.]
MKCFQVIFFLFLFQVGFSQNDIFDIARKGTVQELYNAILLNKKAIDSIDSRGFTPLILACYRGNISVAIEIIQKSKLLDYASSNGTALAATVMSEKIELANELLKNKANPNITDSNGVSPLMLAIQFQKTEFIELFIKYGASKTTIDKSGKSVFEYAVFSKNEQIINLLKN